MWKGQSWWLSRPVQSLARPSAPPLTQPESLVLSPSDPRQSAVFLPHSNHIRSCINLLNMYNNMGQTQVIQFAIFRCIYTSLFPFTLIFQRNLGKVPSKLYVQSTSDFLQAKLSHITLSPSSTYIYILHIHTYIPSLYRQLQLGV